jgi:hypothetical protein
MLGAETAMAIYETFSNRNQARPESLVYDALPEALRLHCVRVVRQAIGNYDAALDDIDEVLQREHPKLSFVRDPILSLDGRPPRYTTRLWEDCLTQGDFFEAMDAIELAACVIDDRLRKLPKSGSAPAAPSHIADEALDEMNARFTQHGAGYQFSKQQGRFVRVDSEFMHKEVAEPAMALLTEKGFEGAAQEFERAHHFYRQMAVDPDAGKEAVSNALKAVESTAKAISDARCWRYDQRDTMKKLVEMLFAKGLVPAELEAYFSGLRTVLESGLPTIRNRMAGHGQGTRPKPIPEHVVGFAMHLAASTIRFLVEAHRAM